MKTKLLLCSLTLAGWQVLSKQTNAQTSINIQHFSDSMVGGYCPPPVNVNFMAWGQTAGYGLTDSLDIWVDFGDGNTYWNRIEINQGGWFSDWGISNTYIFSGIFSLRCIVTGPDGNADTAYHTILVGDTCGNINGKMYVDANGDCMYNTGEMTLASIPVLLKQNNNLIATAYTDATGDYAFNAPSNSTYDIVPAANISSYGYSVTCPASGQHTNVSVPASGKDFGMTCLPGHDLQTVLSGWGFRPGFHGYVYPQAFNTHCQPMSGQLELILDPLTSYVSANPAPVSISGDTLRWNFSNINNSNYWWLWNSFYPHVTVYVPPSAQIGDTVCFTTKVTPTTGDANVTNNTYSACYAVSNSWDPNMKEVFPAGSGPNGNLPVGMHTMNYTIHFQNTGNDTAFNIFILDTIDTNLDINTFQAVASSHPMQVDILPPGNVVKFAFPNIMLVDSNKNEPLSHGQIFYTIRTKANLPVGTQIKNTAYIYFDYNPAVVTNTTINTIGMFTSVNELSSQNFISIYPNPATTNVWVVLSQKQNNAEISVVNAFGQPVLKTKATQKVTNLDVRNLSEGIYNLIVNNGKQNTCAKLILIK